MIDEFMLNKSMLVFITIYMLIGHALTYMFWSYFEEKESPPKHKISTLEKRLVYIFTGILMSVMWFILVPLLIVSEIRKRSQEFHEDLI